MKNILCVALAQQHTNLLPGLLKYFPYRILINLICTTEQQNDEELGRTVLGV